MKDYKAHLETLIADIRKKVFEEEELKDTFKFINKNYEIIQKQLAELTKILDKQNKTIPIQLIDNLKFIELMGISSKTAQVWRDKGIIGFSQIGNKIYYRIEDIKKLLDNNYNRPNNI
mgnify:CR=1 FL=1